MRNDARPLGEHSPESPLGGRHEPVALHDQSRPGDRHAARRDRPAARRPATGREQAPIESERPDSLESFGRGRDSHIVNRPAEERQPVDPDDPVTPSSDTAPNAKI